MVAGVATKDVKGGAHWVPAMRKAGLTAVVDVDPQSI